MGPAGLPGRPVPAVPRAARGGMAPDPGGIATVAKIFKRCPCPEGPVGDLPAPVGGPLPHHRRPVQPPARAVLRQRPARGRGLRAQGRARQARPRLRRPEGRAGAVPRRGRNLAGPAPRRGLQHRDLPVGAARPHRPGDRRQADRDHPPRGHQGAHRRHAPQGPVGQPDRLRPPGRQRRPRRGGPRQEARPSRRAPASSCPASSPPPTSSCPPTRRSRRSRPGCRRTGPPPCG